MWDFHVGTEHMCSVPTRNDRLTINTPVKQKISPFPEVCEKCINAIRPICDNIQK
jgi:hypothetical protein